MKELHLPYWIAREQLPGLDFNRHVVAPGTRDDLPDGALAIYVDDDFWCVACLPADPYLDMKLEDVVAELWPTYAEQATYAPDHGTEEQRLYFENAAAEAAREHDRHVEEELLRLRTENTRLKAGRTDVTPRRTTRLEANNNYFVRQYEHLLVATAHDNQPREDLPGICSICGLYGSDRVHQQEWIERRKAGYRPGMDWHGEFGDDRSAD